MEPLYTQLRNIQFRGPIDSEDYNLRVEENYRDLVTLKNEVMALSEDMRSVFGHLLKEQMSLTNKANDLDNRLDSLETNRFRSSLFDSDELDNDRFRGTSFEIPASARLTLDAFHGLALLPRVESNSLSKLTFTDAEGNSQILTGADIRIVGIDGTADTTDAHVDTSDPQFAALRSLGRIWERNVVVSAPDDNGAACYVYVKIPNDLLVTDKSNVLILHPYPVFGVDVEEVAVTTNGVVMLDDQDDYRPLNRTGMYAGRADAVGWVPPGGWTGDLVYKAGPKAYYYDSQLITGLRLRLRQRTSFLEGGSYVYSYGLSLLDIRYDKFLSTGKTMVRIDPPNDITISSIDDVQPYIFNIAAPDVPDAFSYRVIWETSYNSHVYTTSPVPNSQRVWIEVTLNQVTDQSTPALAGLDISYS